MLRADVSDASMLLKSFHVVCIDEAASVGVYGLIVGVNVEQHRCQYTSLW